MAFDLQKFYQELDQHYAAHDNGATECFLTESRDKAYEEGLVIPVNDGCPSCVPPLEPNMAYVAVCNEMACFYRGLSRWQESLDTFSLAQQELESLYRQGSAEYATVLLNKAGNYRYMGDLDQALEHFTRAAGILEAGRGAGKGVLAGLYNNIGLVYLDRREPQQAVEYFLRALPLVSEAPDQIVELGSTWNNLAAGYQAMGQKTEAGQAIENAVAILSELDCGTNPHYPAALNTRGTFAFYEGNYEQALDDFTEALDKTKLVYGKNVEYAYGCDNCAAVCRKLGREPEAAAWAERGRQVRAKLGM